MVLNLSTPRNVLAPGAAGGGGCGCGCKGAAAPQRDVAFVRQSEGWPWWYWLVAAGAAFAVYKLWFTPQDRSIRRRGRQLRTLKKDLDTDRARINKKLDSMLSKG